MGSFDYFLVQARQFGSRLKWFPSFDLWVLRTRFTGSCVFSNSGVTGMERETHRDTFMFANSTMARKDSNMALTSAPQYGNKIGVRKTH